MVEYIETQCCFCAGKNPSEEDLIPIKKWEKTKNGLKKLIRYLKIHNSCIIINGKAYYFDSVDRYRNKLEKEVKKCLIG